MSGSDGKKPLPFAARPELRKKKFIPITEALNMSQKADADFKDRVVADMLKSRIQCEVVEAFENDKNWVEVWRKKPEQK